MNIKSLAKRTIVPLWRRYENYLVKGFHRIYYNGRMGEGKIFKATAWMGTPCLKCPLDMWIYQEILNEVRPDLIIETGTNEGGSALFLANMLDMLGNGNVVTIDILERARPQHPRIEYVTGSSSDAALVDDVIGRRKFGSCMVILDSDHSMAHVRQELKVLSRYVTPGSYLIVEDTNINGHPVVPDFGPGPYEAVEEFLKADERFVRDTTREKFLLTFNPAGYLRRVR